jgi:hypothetical protein
MSKMVWAEAKDLQATRGSSILDTSGGITVERRGAEIETKIDGDKYQALILPCQA